MISPCVRRHPGRLALLLAPVLAPVLAAVALPLPAVRAQTQVQLSCGGTLLEARGNAEIRRQTQRLLVSLALEADAADADRALATLQLRLAAVRQRLRELQVQELRVSSPSTWQRSPLPRSGDPTAVASLQVSGELAPAQLQRFLREVGALPGVRLNPVSTQADQAANPAIRARLLRAAYQDALSQARELAAAIGLSRLQPLEVRPEGFEFRPMALRAAAADVPPFDPAELPQPSDRLSLVGRFCAR